MPAPASRAISGAGRAIERARAPAKTPVPEHGIDALVEAAECVDIVDSSLATRSIGGNTALLDGVLTACAAGKLTAKPVDVLTGTSTRSKSGRDLGW